MYKLMNSLDGLHVYKWGGIYYFGRPIPADLRQFYSASRISFSLKTKSLATALRHAKSVRQKLEDYWLGLRLQRIDVPQIKVSTNDLADNGVGLKVALNEEVGRLRKVISDNKNSHSSLGNRMEDLSALLESFSNRDIDDSVVLKVLQVQEFCKELV